MIYTGEKAKLLFKKNIDSRCNKIIGYFKDSIYWIAFDNTSLDMFVEEFKDEKYAIAWVNGLTPYLTKRLK